MIRFAHLPQVRRLGVVPCLAMMFVSVILSVAPCAIAGDFSPSELFDEPSEAAPSPAQTPREPRSPDQVDPQRQGPRAPLAPCDQPTTPGADADPFVWPRYLKLRFNEDYSGLVGLEQIPYRDVFDRVKYLPLNDAGDIYLSLGAQARIRMEGYNNFNFGRPQNDDDDFYILQRYFLHADLHVGPNLRFYVQTRSAWANERDLPGGRSASFHD